MNLRSRFYFYEVLSMGKLVVLFVVAWPDVLSPGRSLTIRHGPSQQDGIASALPTPQAFDQFNSILYLSSWT